MSLLFETIRLQDGVFQNLEYHTFRMNQSRKVLFNSSDSIDLALLLSIPSGSRQGVYKCRVNYSKQVEEISFEAYSKRKITSLRVIEDNAILYNHKYCNRDHLNELFSKRGNYDEILILKDGLITDTSFSNIIFFDGTQWISPASPLLPGTMRSFLLKNKIVTEEHLKLADLKRFEKARLINAMLPFKSETDIAIDHIIY